MTEESNWEERHPIAARFLDEAHAITEGWDTDETDYLLGRLAGHLEYIAAQPEGLWKDLAEHQAASTADDYLELVAWVADIEELVRTKKHKLKAVMARQYRRREERMERRLAKAEERHELWKAERDQKMAAIEEEKEAHRPRVTRLPVGVECGCACGWYISLPTRDDVKKAHQAHVREMRGI